ncbi:hypothetical protein [Streptosporangium sandarakinum]
MKSVGTNRLDSGGFDFSPPTPERKSKSWPAKWVGILVLACALGFGVLYANGNDTPQPTWEWKPKSYDPPVQYAFIPDDAKCGRLNPGLTEEDAEPPLVVCTEWRLRVNYKRGDGRQDIGIPYASSCGGRRGGVDIGDDDCTSDIELYDAASQVRLSDAKRRNITLRITRDGHRIAYFSKKHLRFMGWDLPTAQQKAISPRLDAQMLSDLYDLEISPDGEFFAMTFAGDQPRLLLTEFATGRTTTLEGFCTVLGMSRGASVIAAQRTCPDLDKATRVTILKPDGSVIAEQTSIDVAGDLSPDGRSIVEVRSAGQDEYIVTHDTITGETVRKSKLRLISEPNDAVGDSWLSDDEYIVRASTPEFGEPFGYYRVNIRSGASRRIPDLGLDPGGKVSLGAVFIRD